MSSREIIKKIKRFRANNEDVVGAHGDEVNADGVVAIERKSEFEFCSYTVGSGHQDWPSISIERNLKEPTEATNSSQALWPLGFSDEWLDALNQVVAGVNINPSVAVTERGVGWIRHAVDHQRG